MIVVSDKIVLDGVISTTKDGRLAIEIPNDVIEKLNLTFGCKIRITVEHIEEPPIVMPPSGVSFTCPHGYKTIFDGEKFLHEHGKLDDSKRICVDVNKVIKAYKIIDNLARGIYRDINDPYKYIRVKLGFSKSYEPFEHDEYSVTLHYAIVLYLYNMALKYGTSEKKPVEHSGYMFTLIGKIPSDKARLFKFLMALINVIVTYSRELIETTYNDIISGLRNPECGLNRRFNASGECETLEVILKKGMIGMIGDITDVTKEHFDELKSSMQEYIYLYPEDCVVELVGFESAKGSRNNKVQ